MKTFTTHLVPGLSIGLVAASTAKRMWFAQFLSNSSQNGWNHESVHDTQAGLFFVFSATPPAGGSAPPLPQPPVVPST